MKNTSLEFYASFIFFFAALLLFNLTTVFVLTDRMRIFLVAFLVLWGTYRLSKGIAVIGYHCQMRSRYPSYVSLSRLCHKDLLIGKGFLWTSLHTQRVFDVMKYSDEIRGNTPEGNPILHGVSMREKNITVPERDRVAHTLVLGTTRVGKTRFAELLIAQDILKSHVVIVLDPKGDLGLLDTIQKTAIAAGRERAVRIFHLGHPKESCRYNPIGQFDRVSEVANRVTSQLCSEGESLVFKNFSWQFVNVIAEALVSMGIRPTYKKIDFYLHHRDVLLKQYSKIPENSEQVLSNLLEMNQYDTLYYTKLIASVSALLKKLTAGDYLELLSPGTEGTHLNWQQVIKQKQIVYVGLDALSDATVAGTVGNALFDDLVSVAGVLYKTNKSHVPVCIHSDEFNELIGDSFIPLLNKAGGVNFRVTAYTQTWSDVEARVGKKAKAGQIAGNFNTLVLFRVKEEASADMLLRQLPKVDVKDTLQISSVSDASMTDSSTRFKTTTSESPRLRELPMLTYHQIVSLPRGEAFCLMSGGQLYKLRMPLIKLNNRRKYVFEKSRK